MLNLNVVSLIKGMLIRGDFQHDIAATFGINQGRVSEIHTGKLGASVSPAPEILLPPPRPKAQLSLF